MKTTLECICRYFFLNIFQTTDLSQTSHFLNILTSFISSSSVFFTTSSFFSDVSVSIFSSLVDFLTSDDSPRNKMSKSKFFSKRKLKNLFQLKRKILQCVNNVQSKNKYDTNMYHNMSYDFSWKCHVNWLFITSQSQGNLRITG